MSTNAVVAVGDLKNWKGVVDYWDGMPTGTGQDLLNVLDDVLANVPVERTADALRSLGDLILKARRWEVFRGREDDNRNLPLITSEHPDPLHIAWVYIINPEKGVIHVLTTMTYKWVAPPKGSKVHISGGVLCDCEPVQLRDGRWHYGHMILKHYHLADIVLRGRRQSMQSLENEANENYKRRVPASAHVIFGFFGSALQRQMIAEARRVFKTQASKLGFPTKVLGKTVEIDDEPGKIVGLWDGKIIIRPLQLGVRYLNTVNVSEVRKALAIG